MIDFETTFIAPVPKQNADAAGDVADSGGLPREVHFTYPTAVSDLSSMLATA